MIRGAQRSGQAQLNKLSVGLIRMQTLYLDLIQLSLRLLPLRLLPLGDLLQHIVVVLVFAYYLSITNRSATRTLFVRPYLAHFCSFFRRFFAVLSVLTRGIQKVVPKDRGPVP